MDDVIFLFLEQLFELGLLISHLLVSCVEFILEIADRAFFFLGGCSALLALVLLVYEVLDYVLDLFDIVELLTLIGLDRGGEVEDFLLVGLLLG